MYLFDKFGKMAAIDFKYFNKLKMESRVRHFQLAVLLACGIATTGCAVTSGLQTYDLPTQGAYQTDQGAQLTVVQLTQDNLPSLLLNNIQSANSTYHLFNNKPDIYRLTAGDVLSIQLWAYPEYYTTYPRY